MQVPFQAPFVCQTYQLPAGIATGAVRAPSMFIAIAPTAVGQVVSEAMPDFCFSTIQTVPAPSPWMRMVVVAQTMSSFSPLPRPTFTGPGEQANVVPTA